MPSNKIANALLSLTLLLVLTAGCQQDAAPPPTTTGTQPGVNAATNAGAITGGGNTDQGSPGVEPPATGMTGTTGAATGTTPPSSSGDTGATGGQADTMTGTAGAAGGGAASPTTGAPAMQDSCEKLTADPPAPVQGNLAGCIEGVVDYPCRSTQPDHICTPEPSADPTSLNRCRNESDCEVSRVIVEMEKADPEAQSLSNIARACGLPLLGIPECATIDEAAIECIQEETANIMAPGLSAECAGCYSQSLLCNLRCLQQCSTDAEAPDCIACQHVVGCRGLFYQCSGLEPAAD